MRIARATEEDLHEMIDYFTRKEKSGTNIPNGWRRVVFGCSVLLEECADLTEDNLDWSPYFNHMHVAPEM